MNRTLFALIALVATLMLSVCDSQKTQSSAPTPTSSPVQAPVSATTPCATPTPDASPTATPTPEPTPDKIREQILKEKKEAIEKKYKEEQEQADKSDREVEAQALHAFAAQDQSACVAWLIADKVFDSAEQYRLANTNPIVKNYRDAMWARASASVKDRNDRADRRAGEIKALEQQ